MSIVIAFIAGAVVAVVVPKVFSFIAAVIANFSKV